MKTNKKIHFQHHIMDDTMAGNLVSSLVDDDPDQKVSSPPQSKQQTHSQSQPQQQLYGEEDTKWFYLDPQVSKNSWENSCPVLLNEFSHSISSQMTSCYFVESGLSDMTTDVMKLKLKNYDLFLREK